ncbi:MarR family winged helix-turn-helix transcriptional regulator [Kitasatospora sp. NPDC051914]|uniref:MarR family winged helix-turn-helix transcriptional regulator n=1 Tax=Kitasatospora sp. NPDC051914 TaxID=3154945 RepID=UPI00342E9104
MDRNREPDEAPAAAPDVADIARALAAIRRSQSRRALARLAERRAAPQAPDTAGPTAAAAQAAAATPAGPPSDAVVLLLDAVEESAAPTVTEAAAALGVDQPRASRLASQALAAGLLRREADQADGRRSLLRLTADGRAVLDGVHAFRRLVVAEATADWSDADRAAFARLLTRFVADFGAVTGTADRPKP